MQKWRILSGVQHGEQLVGGNAINPADVGYGVLAPRWQGRMWPSSSQWVAKSGRSIQHSLP